MGRCIQLFIMIIGLSACNPMDKTITLPLSTKEITKCSQDDPLFIPMYVLVEHAQKERFIHKYIESKYYGLTYKDLRRALELRRRSEMEEGLAEEFLSNEIGFLKLTDEEWMYIEGSIDRGFSEKGDSIKVMKRLDLL